MLVMGYLAKAQTNGADINAKIQMTMVFETLSKEFIPFRATFNLSNRRDMNLTELMKQLQEFELLIRESPTGSEANMVAASGSNSNSFE